MRTHRQSYTRLFFALCAPVQVAVEMDSSPRKARAAAQLVPHVFNHVCLMLMGIAQQQLLSLQPPTAARLRPGLSRVHSGSTSLNSDDARLWAGAEGAGSEAVAARSSCWFGLRFLESVVARELTFHISDSQVELCRLLCTLLAVLWYELAISRECAPALGCHQRVWSPLSDAG